MREEKLQVQKEAERREAERLHVGRKAPYSIQLSAVPCQREGDRMGLPQSVLEDLQQASFGSAMTFRLTTKAGAADQVAYGGVLEFTAAPGVVELPLKVLRKLGLTEETCEGVVLQLEAAVLPKGTFVKLEPGDPAAFAKLGNPRAQLQASLAMYNTTLSVGDSFPLLCGPGIVHWMRVVELKPANAISLIDTELEVDLFIPSFVVSPTPAITPA